MGHKQLKFLLAALIALAMIVQLAACTTEPAGTPDEAPDEAESTVEPAEEDTQEDVDPAEGDTPTAEGAAYTAGTYQSTQQGHNGFVEIAVTFSDDAITDIEVLSGYETPGVSNKALRDLPDAIMAGQTLNVDTITGATISSMAMLRGVEDCVEQAGGDPALLKPDVEEPAPQAIEKTADIIIVGGGGAGLAAAVAAAENGASVIIVEKVGYVGGNTMVAGGIYNTPDEPLQQNTEMTPGLAALVEEALAEAPVDDDHAAIIAEVQAQYDEYQASGSTALFDTIQWYALQTWNGGDKVADLQLVRVLAEQALDALHWVGDLGFEYTDEIQLGAGALYPRTHVAVKPLGTGYIEAYEASLDRLGVEVIYDTTVETITMTDGAATGATGTDKKGNTYTFTADKAVIISTGGFAGNLETVQQYNTTGKWPDLSGAKTTNLPGISGDGIKMAEDIGAGLRDMDQIQLLFICDPVTGIATYATFQPTGAAGCLFLNAEGNRFVREDGRRDEIALGILEQTDSMMYMLQCLDSGVDMDTTDLAGVPIADLIEMGAVFHGETLEEVCEAAGIPYEAAQAAVDEFNGLVDENATSDQFDRALFTVKMENGPWFITPRAPSVHHTMGGITINTQCQVLDVDGEIIPGLFAAGEVVGGIHGGNRLGGNAIVDTVVFGRLAGTEASK